MSDRRTRTRTARTTGCRVRVIFVVLYFFFYTRAFSRIDGRRIAGDNASIINNVSLSEKGRGDSIIAKIVTFSNIYCIPVYGNSAGTDEIRRADAVRRSPLLYRVARILPLHPFFFRIYHPGLTGRDDRVPEPVRPKKKNYFFGF